jgi:DNA-binding NarL/FixJ family response regulator
VLKSVYPVCLGWRKEDGVRLMMAVSCCIFREGIRKAVEAETDINIVSEATSSKEIFTLLEQTKPDVLFIDAGLTDLNILKIMELINEKSPETKVVLLLHTSDEETMINAISLGIWGYLTDASNFIQLIRAIKSVHEGEFWAERKIIAKTFSRILLSRKGRQGLIKPKLTPREEEIIELVAQGYSNKQISKKLLISEKTVKAHLTSIFNKLGITNRLNLAVDFLSENPTKSSPRTKVVENY